MKQDKHNQLHSKSGSPHPKHIHSNSLSEFQEEESKKEPQNEKIIHDQNQTNEQIGELTEKRRESDPFLFQEGEQESPPNEILRDEIEIIASSNNNTKEKEQPKRHDDFYKSDKNHKRNDHYHKNSTSSRSRSRSNSNRRRKDRENDFMVKGRGFERKSNNFGSLRGWEDDNYETVNIKLKE